MSITISAIKIRFGRMRLSLDGHMFPILACDEAVYHSNDPQDAIPPSFTIANHDAASFRFPGRCIGDEEHEHCASRTSEIPLCFRDR